MDDDHISKDLLYGELASGSRVVGSSQLGYKDVCKCDTKACNIDPETWEVTAENRILRKWQGWHGLKQGEPAMYDDAKGEEGQKED